jgi:Flp pilus assembly protein TadG
VLVSGAVVDQPSPKRRRLATDERGIAAIWMVVVLFVMLGVAAIAVDLVRALLVQQEAQNVADAAALGGVVYLPGAPSSAIQTATDVAKSNGWVNGQNQTTVTAQQMAIPSRLQVKVTRTVPTFFAHAIGFDNLTISRTATADYDQPVAMGSPSNSFGNQPDCASPCTNTPGSENPQLWFNVAGPNSTKQNGDAFTARLCDIDGSHAADNCPGSGAGNADYDGNGYTFDVHNTSNSGNVDIQVFDPAFVNVGDTCTDSHLGALYTATANNPRYATGPTSQYCSGDQLFTYSTAPWNVNTPPATTYTVTWDPGTPWTTSDDIPICSRTFQGFSDAQSAYADTTNGRPYFRQWVDITAPSNNSTGNSCSALLPAEQGTTAGDYLLQVTTSSGSGHNRGSIRACSAACPNGTNASNLSIYARTRMALYANYTGADTQFYLARVLPGAAGRTLVISLFDVGDAGQAGQMRVLPPADDTAQSSFSGCTIQQPPGYGTSTGPPYGTYSNTSDATPCTETTVSSSTGWNGQWVNWKVPIPTNYTCNASSPSGCWIKLQVAYPSGTNVADTTTWEATLEGNPVRLVQ